MKHDIDIERPGRQIVGPLSREWKAKYGERKHVDPTRGPQGERGPAGPPAQTVRLWAVICILALSLATGLGVAGSKIASLEHRLDAQTQTTPQK